MRKLVVILGILTVSAQAAVIGLFNTGGILPSGTPDPNYSLAGPANCTAPGSCIAQVVNPATYPAGNGTWVTDASSPGSEWIGPLENFNSNGSYPFAGLFDYSLNVMATAGDTVSGRWTADNDACIVVNSGPTTNCIGGAVFNSWNAFTITGFTTGANTIHFRVNNVSGPTGLRVEFAPEPNSLVLLCSGLAAFGLFLRRARR